MSLVLPPVPTGLDNVQLIRFLNDLRTALAGVTTTATTPTLLTSGTSFPVPATCNGWALISKATAGGAPGAGVAAANKNSGAGGGAAEFCQNFYIRVTVGGTFSYVIGAAGIGTTGNGTIGTATTFTDAEGRVYTLLPGALCATPTGGIGGGFLAGAAAAAGLAGANSVYEGAGFNAGPGGGGGNTGVAPLNGGPGGNVGGFAGGIAGIGAGVNNGSGGGAASIFGPGAAGVNGDGVNVNGNAPAATAYGASGSGAPGNTGTANRLGGNGRPGAIEIIFLA